MALLCYTKFNFVNILSGGGNGIRKENYILFYVERLKR